MSHVPLSVVPLSCCLVIPLSHHTLPQRRFQQCVLLRQLFDLFAERRHLDGIMQANQVEEQDAEQENRCRRQDGADQVSDENEQVVADGDKENGCGAENPKPSVFFPEPLSPNQFKDQKDDEDTCSDGEHLLSGRHFRSPPKREA